MRLSLRATTNWASTPARKIAPVVPMSNKEFRQLCAALKITDNGTAAELFGLHWRTCQRYWYGDKPPEPLARLLRLAARRKLTHDELRSLVL